MIVLTNWNQKIWSIDVSYCVEHLNIQRNSIYFQGHWMKVHMVEEALEGSQNLVGISSHRLKSLIQGKVNNLVLSPGLGEIIILLTG